MVRLLPSFSVTIMGLPSRYGATLGHSIKLSQFLPPLQQCNVESAINLPIGARIVIILIRAVTLHAFFVIHQLIGLHEFYKLMDSFFSNFEFINEFLAENRNFSNE